MEDHELAEEEPEDAMVHLATHLFEKFDTLNTILAEIADRLGAIEERLSKAKALEADD